MRTSADVVIIGAGIQGLSAAYHLAKLGIREVCVVEKEHIGAGSSGRSASMLMKQVSTETKVRMAHYCFEQYMTFHDELGADPEYKRIGTLSFFSPAQQDDALRVAHMQAELGVRVEILPTEELAKRLPFLNMDGVALGILGVEDGIIDAHAIMQGYAAGARRLGVEIAQQVRAEGVQTQNGRVTGVKTSAGMIATRWVVNAAGAEAAEVGEWVGLKLPITPRRRNIYITHAFPPIPADIPFVQDEIADWYFRKEGPGVLLGMGKEDVQRASDSMNVEFLPQILEVAMHRVPVLAEASILRGWSGLRPLTPDQYPILGPVEGLEGYVNDCGWGGEGVMFAPIGGQLVAEFIANGTTQTLELAPFLLSRFQI